MGCLLTTHPERSDARPAHRQTTLKVMVHPSSMNSLMRHLNPDTMTWVSGFICVFPPKTSWPMASADSDVGNKPQIVIHIVVCRS